MLGSSSDSRCQTGYARADVSDISTGRARPASRPQHRVGRRESGLGRIAAAVTQPTPSSESRGTPHVVPPHVTAGCRSFPSASLRACASRDCARRIAGTGDSHRSTRVDQYQVLGLAYGPQECTDADWRRPTLQKRPGIPGAGMPVQVLGTGLPAYCGGCPRCRSFASLRTTRRCGSFPSAPLRAGASLRTTTLLHHLSTDIDHCVEQHLEVRFTGSMIHVRDADRVSSAESSA